MTQTASKNSAVMVAFDTVFEQCSVAVCADDSCHALTKDGKRGQTEDILPLLDACLAACDVRLDDVDLLAFNRGPGAFSGIRINTAVAQALSVAIDAPCVAVSSLHALAFMLHEQKQLPVGTRIAALIDARQNQVYAGRFVVTADGVAADERYQVHECLYDYDMFIDTDWTVGDGAPLIRAEAQTYQGRPDASHVARLAKWLLAQNPDAATSAEQALPVYLRNNAWKTLAEQGKATSIK